MTLASPAGGRGPAGVAEQRRPGRRRSDTGSQPRRAAGWLAGRGRRTGRAAGFTPTRPRPRARRPTGRGDADSRLARHRERVAVSFTVGDGVACPRRKAACRTAARPTLRCRRLARCAPREERRWPGRRAPPPRGCGSRLPGRQRRQRGGVRDRHGAARHAARLRRPRRQRDASRAGRRGSPPAPVTATRRAAPRGGAGAGGEPGPSSSPAPTPSIVVRGRGFDRLSAADLARLAVGRRHGRERAAARRHRAAASRCRRRSAGEHVLSLPDDARHRQPAARSCAPSTPAPARCGADHRRQRALGAARRGAPAGLRRQHRARRDPALPRDARRLGRRQAGAARAVRHRPEPRRQPAAGHRAQRQGTPRRPGRRSPSAPPTPRRARSTRSRVPATASPSPATAAPG